MAAKVERRRDALGLPANDPGTERVLPELIAWLCRAQDHSRSRDGGVARDYSLVHGWASSYPETTGYIIPTIFEYSRRTGDNALRARALRMTDWLASIQLEDGSFQGGKVDSKPRVPVVFNTGQILIGLAAAQAETGRYRESMRRAADWLVRVQDADGHWRRYRSPFALTGETSYETHVAWGLFEADRLEPSSGYGEAGLENVRRVVASMQPNGWFPNCCLSNSELPLTHTLGYALRGVIEAYRFRPDDLLLDAAARSAQGMIRAMRPDGFIAGQFASDWTPAASWACLTGTAQLACCWLLMHRLTGDPVYLGAAMRANSYVRRTVRVSEAPPEQQGAVKGSFPVDGEYGRYQYLSWAAKFTADSLMMEQDALSGSTANHRGYGGV